MTEKKLYCLVLIIFLIFSSLIHISLLSGGYIINADFTRANDLDSFTHDFLPLWNENGGYSNIFRLSKLLIYTPVIFLDLLNINFIVTPVFFFYFVVLSTISGFSIFLLSKYLISQSSLEPEKKYSNMIYLSSGLFYILSTYIVEQITHPTIRYGFYLSPLILYTLIRGINERNKKFLVISVFLWSLAMADMHWALFGSIIIFGYIFYFYLLEFMEKNNRILIIKDFLINFSLISGLFFLINSYWIFPGIISGGTSIYGKILTKENILIFFRNAGFNNLLAMKANFNLQENYGHIPEFLDFLNVIDLNFLLIFLTSIGLISFVLIKNKSREYLYLFFIFIISILLSAGPKLFENLFFWFMFKAPFYNIYAWAFRTPKFHQFIILSIAVMLAFTGVKIITKINKLNKRRFALGFFIVILTCIMFANYPILTGDFNGRLETIELPDKYDNVISYLDNNQVNSKSVWGPPFEGLRSSWNENRIGDFTNDISKKPTFDSQFFNDNFNNPLIFGIRYFYNSMIYNNQTNNLAKFYQPLNIEYVVVHEDIPAINSKTNELIKIIKYQNDIELKLKRNYISIFKIENVTPKFSIKNNNLILDGGLFGYNSLTYNNFLNFSNKGIFYSDFLEIKEDLHFSEIFITNGEGSLIPFYYKGIIIEPYKFTNNYDPLNTWSKTKINSLEFRNLLLENDLINRYQFDYGKGIVLTKVSKIVEESPELTENDIIFSEGFEKNTIKWNYTNGDQQKLSLNDKYYVEGDNSLRINLDVAKEGWKIIKSSLISIDYENRYELRFFAKADNIHKAHTKIVEISENGEIVETKYLGSIGDGTFDWKQVTYQFIPSSNQTHNIEIQIWHGHNTDKTIPNRLWLDDITLYDLNRVSSKNSLEINFEVKKKSDYEFFARIFQNKKGGKINIYLDNQLIEKVETNSYFDGFVWNDLGSIFLDVGTHTIIVENKEGFNAINLFKLISIDDLDDNNQYGNIVFLLEPEIDMYSEKTNFQHIGGIVSNGKIAKLKTDSKIWKEIIIPNDGYYTFKIKMDGYCDLNIDNNTYQINSTDFKYNYINAYLNNGSHEIKLSSSKINKIQWNFKLNDVNEWINENSLNQNYSLSQYKENNGYGLKVQLDESKFGWKTIKSPIVPVKAYKKYNWTFQIKGENAHQAHAKIVEYDEKNHFLKDTRVGFIGDGTFDWTEFSFGVEINSNKTKYMQLQIWHGYNTSKSLPNILYLKNITTQGYSVSNIDLIWIYSSDNETYSEDFLPIKNKPAELLSQKQVSSTEYNLIINASSPFMLAFAEAFDDGWIAYDGDRTYEPHPIYGVSNGYWINKTGNIELTIKYKPVDWFVIGSIITIITFAILLTYLAFEYIDWRKIILIEKNK